MTTYNIGTRLEYNYNCAGAYKIVTVHDKTNHIALDTCTPRGMRLQAFGQETLYSLLTPEF